MENLQAVIKQEAGKITCNFGEMKQFLSDRLEEYRGAVFTDDSIKLAKGYAAKLRKEQQEFKGRITAVKKEYMQPFDDFKSQADELVSLCDEPISFIDTQIKDFTERQKAGKKKLVTAIYEETAADVSGYIPLTKIYNPKWENATYKEKDIRKEITGLAESVRQAVETITGMESGVTDKALAMYKTDLSLSDAVAYVNSYERQKAEILLREQERQRQSDAERIRREEREKIEAGRRAQEEILAAQGAARTAREELISAREMARGELETAVGQAREEAAQEVVDSLTPELTGETGLYEYRMSLTSDAKQKLEMYLDSVGIEWEMV